VLERWVIVRVEVVASDDGQATRAHESSGDMGADEPGCAGDEDGRWGHDVATAGGLSRRRIVREQPNGNELSTVAQIDDNPRRSEFVRPGWREGP
jgi:hypothetical protein